MAVLSGEVLSRWLQRRDGTVLRGSSVRLSRSGLLRVSTVDDSRPVRILLPVRYGGQAAVARAELADGAGPALALRVGAVTSREEQSRQTERLLSMLSVVTAARERPEVYPSVLPVVESFVSTVSGAELGIGTDEHELWCDVMVWCGANLAEVVQAEGSASRRPDVVVSRMAPVVATVKAVHENLGVIHRDITPHNVLVDDAGRLLLADWGIAHLIADDKTSTHTQRLGNLGFSVPPETLRGDTAVGRYTDAWYLGSLLVWMLAGQPPDAGFGETWLPPALDQAGERLAAVAQGLCRIDPRQRMGLPEATGRLAELVGQRGPVALAGPALPMAQALRTSDSSTMLTAPAPGLPSTPDPPGAPGAPGSLGAQAPGAAPARTGLADPAPPVSPARTDGPPTGAVAADPPTSASRIQPTELLQPRPAPARSPDVPGAPVLPTSVPEPGRPAAAFPAQPNPAPPGPGPSALPGAAGPSYPAAPTQPGQMAPLGPGPFVPPAVAGPPYPAAAPAQPGLPAPTPPDLRPLAGAVGPSSRPAAPAPPNLWQQPTELVAPSSARPRQVPAAGPGLAAQAAATEMVRPADRPGYTVPYQAGPPASRSTVMSSRPPSFAPPTTTPPARRRRHGVLAVVVAVVAVGVVVAVAVAFRMAG